MYCISTTPVEETNSNLKEEGSEELDICIRQTFILWKYQTKLKFQKGSKIFDIVLMLGIVVEGAQSHSFTLL